MSQLDTTITKNDDHGEPIREEYGDSVRERIRALHAELPPMPGEPAILKLSTDVLPNKTYYE